MTDHTVTIDLNPNTDPLAVLESKIRGNGAWCRVFGKFDLRHKMICKRSASTIAISRCGQIIVPFEKLQEDTEAKKCLVCSLYDEAEEEVKLTSERTLERIVNEMSIKP